MIRLLPLFLLSFFLQTAVADEPVELPESCEIKSMNAIQCPIDEGVSMEEAIDSMKLRANSVNFKLVAHMPLSEQVESMGGKSNRMEIFQFCDAMIAAQMVGHNIAFAGYLPCRIALIEDQNKKPWLVTLDMDVLMSDASLPDNLKKLAMVVRNNIYSIIGAGAEGDL